MGTDLGTEVISGIASARDVTDYNTVLMQLAITMGLSIVVIVAFSVFRPRLKKIYAPKNKYHSKDSIEIPPPELSNSFFAWLTPVVQLKEKQMILNIGLDAVTFLRMLRMMLYILLACSVYGLVLFIIYLVYNLKYVPWVSGDTTKMETSSLPSPYRSTATIFTTFNITNISGGWVWPALGFTYVITFTVMGFVWYNWRTMILLRHDWFRSSQYQSQIYSRTIMVTNVPKDYRSDEGLNHLMQQLKVDGIKISHEIDCTAIGRRLGDFPELVDQHNEAVKDLERVLVKYLKHGKEAHRRPTIRKGGAMCCGGRKVDSIDYYAKQIKYLGDQIDQRRDTINSLIRQERKARKAHKSVAPASRIEGESYGFVTFKTMSEAHRIARVHGSKSAKELGGAMIQLAPMPNDIIWKNLTKDSVELHSARMFGWFLLGCLFFAYAVPTFIISVLANLGSFKSVVPFLGDWEDKSKWSFRLVSGTLGPVIQAIFLFILPIFIRRICKRQGAQTRSRLDRASTARYYFIMTIWTLFFLTIFGTVYQTILQIIEKVNEHMSFSDIMSELSNDLPLRVRTAYVSQSTYWLTWLPLRGLLIIYDLIQLIKLALVSFRRLLFSYTPRDIRELTRPYLFDYHIVSVNMLFVMTVALVYAPIAPIVVFASAIVMWFSYIVYKYQLLYVYVSRSESGGRMWNVYINRILFSVVVMQLFMILTAGLIRNRWVDAIAGVPMVFILIGFKIWIYVTIEPRFRFYYPTPQEAEEQQFIAMKDKPIKHSDMERKFLHPALRRGMVFTVMVHKSQEALARDVLAPFPWLTEKDGIRGVREENLEYDPEKDREVATDAGDWETQSIASTDMLSSFGDDRTGYGGSGSAAGSPPGYGGYGSPIDQVPYGVHLSPQPTHTSATYGTPAFGAPYNRSTDELLQSAAPIGYTTTPTSEIADPYAQPMYRSRSGSQDMLLGAAVLPAATGYAPVRYNPPSPPHQYGYPNEHVQVFSPDQMYPVPQLPVQSPRQYQPQPQPQRAQTLQTMQSYPEQHQQYQQPVRSNSAGFPYPQQSVQSPQSPTSYPPSYSRTQSPRPM